MYIVLIPIAFLMLIILVFVLKSTPKRVNKKNTLLKAVVIILFVLAYAAICYYLPANSIQ